MNSFSEEVVFAVGFNHNVVSLASRSAFEILPRRAVDVFKKDFSAEGRSLVELKTCNRYELYGQAPLKQVDCIISDVFRDKGVDGFYTYTRDEAVTHMFKVAGGLDSQVIGDMEILGQFRRAFVEAKQHARLNGYMERLSNTCIQASKAIRSHSDLSTGTVSLSYAAIQILNEASRGSEKNVLVIGAGKFGKSIARNIRKYHPKSGLSIANRTLNNAGTLADELHAENIPFEHVEARLAEFDVVVSALETTDFQLNIHFAADRKERILIDLSVPPLFAGDLSNEKGITLYTLDDAARIVNESLSKRESSINTAQNIIAQYIHEFEEWSKIYLKSRSIRDWKERVSETAKACPHINQLSSTEKEHILQKSVTRFVKYLKESDSDDNGTKIVENFIEKKTPGRCDIHHDLDESGDSAVCLICPNK